MRVIVGCFAALCAAASSSLAATSPLLTWQGRKAAFPDDSVRFDWHSVRFVFNVTGATTVSAFFSSTFPAVAPTPSPHAAARSLQDSSYPKFGVFRVFVDGVRLPGLQSGVVVMPGLGSSETLVSGLDATVSHEISVVYTTDPVFSTWPDLDLGVGCMMALHNVSTDGVFSRAAERTRKILILGDSISSANAVTKPCGTAIGDDWSRSYGFLLCESFQANCTTVSVSSKGLLSNCCDDLNTTIPDFATRTFAQDPQSRFDFADFAPLDAIIVHVGTNDAGHNSGPAWQARFSARWVELIYNLSYVWLPTPPKMVFAALGPNTLAPYPWVLAGMTAAKAQYGIPSTFLNFSGLPLDGCGHPGVIGQPAMAAVAQPIIAAAMGW